MAVGLSCVGGVDVGEDFNPVPFVSLVEPTALVVGTDARTIVVRGSGFVAGSTGLWNGAARPTQLVGDTELQVTLDPADVGAPGSGRLGVSNPEPGGGESAELVLVVGLPAPSVDSVAPDTALAVPSGGLELRVYGERFTTFGSGSVVVFGGVSVPTQVLSEGELLTTVPEHLLHRGQETEVYAINPSPGGGASAPVPFWLVNPTPALVSVSPDSVRLDEEAEVELLGSDFVQGSVVHLGESAYTPEIVSPTRIVFRIPLEGPSRDGRLWVTSPAPGGGDSNELVLGIQERQPQIGRTFPMALEVGVALQTIRVQGLDFAPDAIVRLGDAYRATVVLASNTLEFMATPEDAVAAGTRELFVENPRGGGPSAEHDLAVVPAGRIAYAYRFGPLATSRLNGADRSELRFEEGADWVATFPTGDRVLFTKALGFFHGEPGLFVFEPNGDVTTITTEVVEAPAFSPDGEWIYFTRDGDLLRMRPDGTDSELILPAVPDGVSYGWPDPSPDGSRLVLARSDPGATPAHDLVVLDLQTAQITSLRGVRAYEPRWSPDGEWIAYREMFGSRPRLIRPDGTEDQPVTLDLPIFGLGGMDWSPDGRYLAIMTPDVFDAEEVNYNAGGAIRLLEPATGDVLVIPPADCGCASLDYSEEWRISWFADPTTP